MAKNGLLERLEQDIVLCAEGYLFEMERRGYLQAGPYVPEVVIDRPDALRELHREFLDAGAEVMVAFTYYAYSSKLETIGRGLDVENLNRQALRIAREIASEGDALVAGNLSNTWLYDPKDHEGSRRKIVPMFEDQVRWAVEEGADFFIAETFDYYGEASIALEVIKTSGLPSVITYMPKYDRSEDGLSWVDASKRIKDEGADVVGLNCGRGPATMLPILDEIRGAVDGYIAAQPVTYRTTRAQPSFTQLQEPGGACAFPLGLEPFQPTRFEIADFTRKAKNLGINFLGLCCGNSPHYTRAIAEELGRTVPSSRYSADISKHPYLGTGKTHCDADV
jgi:betaine-homocysteine S-methyltransferase